MVLVACGGSKDDSSDNTSVANVTKLTQSGKANVVTFDIPEKTQQILEAKTLATCITSVDTPVFTAVKFADRVSDSIKNNLTIKDGKLVANLTKYHVPDDTVDSVTGHQNLYHHRRHTAHTSDCDSNGRGRWLGSCD